MFTHPAYARNPRPSYGELQGWNYYAIVLPNGFAMNAAALAGWKSRGAPLGADGFPSGSVVVVQTYAPLLSDYDIVWVNGVDLGNNKLNVSMALPPLGLGNLSAANALENALEKYADNKYSFEDRAPAIAAAKSLWADKSSGASVAAAATAPAGVPTDAEIAAIIGETSSSTASPAAPTAPAAPSVPAVSDKPKTGYYTDGGGYAWYYNAEKDYMEAVAAPKGAFSVQPRFDASKDASKYAKMKGVLTSDAYKGPDKSARSAAISNATSQGGVELPSVAAGRPAPASTPPADVAARGEQKQEEKKMVKAGFRGAVSAIPTWAWVTIGTVTLLGGGYYGYRLYKQHNA